MNRGVPTNGLSIALLIKEAFAQEASDLHITVGRPPSLRVDGEIIELNNYPVLTPDMTDMLIHELLTPEQKSAFERDLELDFSYTLENVGRMRVNVFMQRGYLGAAMRIIKERAPTIEELGLPSILSKIAMYPNGLALVTGPTGCGKSTTLAAMIDHINMKRNAHIVTIEDPIEYLYPHRNCIIDQREVGIDTRSFAEALRRVFRQDPDVILVGEMRDIETMETALRAAETGHLVFSTLHTIDAPQSIDRIVDMFPPHQQQQIRVQLGGTLRAIISQQLLPRISGRGRIAAAEIMIATPAISNLIREGQTHQIYTSIQTGGQYGMQTMNQALRNLVQRRLISRSVALSRSPDPKELKQMVGGV